MKLKLKVHYKINVGFTEVGACGMKQKFDYNKRRLRLFTQYRHEATCAVCKRSKKK